VKKLLVLLLAALGGFAAYRKWQAAQAEEDLWIEATSTPQPDA
jgi:hypothetical protein